jgi:hypothetical protein
VSSLKKWKPKVVLLSSKWGQMYSTEEAEDLLELLEALGSKVFFIEQPPRLYFGKKNTPKYLAHLGFLPSKDPDNPSRYVRASAQAVEKHGRKIFEELATKYENCEIIRIADLYKGPNWNDQNRPVRVIEKTDVLYVDDDHLSYKGALLAKSRLLGAIKLHFKNHNK